MASVIHVVGPALPVHVILQIEFIYVMPGVFQLVIKYLGNNLTSRVAIRCRQSLGGRSFHIISGERKVPTLQYSPPIPLVSLPSKNKTIKYYKVEYSE